MLLLEYIDLSLSNLIILLYLEGLNNHIFYQKVVINFLKNKNNTIK